MGFHSTLFNQTLAQNIDVNGQSKSKDLEYNYIECFTIIWATRWLLKQIFNQNYYEKKITTLLLKTNSHIAFDSMELDFTLQSGTALFADCTHVHCTVYEKLPEMCNRQRQN